jgi:hypothetical protein
MNKLMPAVVASVACCCLLAGQGCGGSSSSGEPGPQGGSTGDSGIDAEASVPEGGPEASPEGGSFKGLVGPLQFLGPWGGQVTRIVASPADPALLFAVVSGKLFRSKDGGGSWTDVAVTTPLSVHSVLPLADGRIFVGTDFDVMLSSDQGSTWTSISTGSIEPGHQFGVQVKGLAWQAGSPGRLWAGLASYTQAPIWYFEDGIDAWKPWTAPAGWLADGSAHISDMEVRADTVSGEDFIVATWDKDFAGGGGVFCSRDSGATFQDCGAGLPSAPFNRVSLYDGVALIAGGHVFGNAYAGVFYSTDQAETWQAFNGGFPNAVANDVMRLQDGTFAVGSYSQGWMTAPSLGANWTADPDLDGQEVATVFEGASKDRIEGSSTLGMKRKKAGASTWENASTGLALTASVDATVDPSSTARMLVSINAENSGMVLQTSKGIDGWGPIPSLPHPRYTYVSIAPSGKWYVVSDGPTTQANDGIYVSSDEGATWDFLGPLQASLMDHEITGVAETSGGGLIAAGKTFPKSAPFLMVSSDSGASWTEAWKGVEGANAGRLIMTQAGDAFMPVEWAGAGLVRMLKGSAAELMTIQPIAGGVTDADVCLTDSKTILATGSVDANSSSRALVQSSDGGATWKELKAAAADDWVMKVAYHPYDCRVLIIATAKGLVRNSANGGALWNDVDQPATRLTSFQHMRALPAAGNEGMLLIVGGGGILGATLSASAM